MCRKVALLKKIRSATLIEALVATVLIVVVFVVASLIMNNLLFNTFSRNTHAVEQRLSELEYKLANKQLRLPYNEVYGNWEIEFREEQLQNINWLMITAINQENQKEVLKSRVYVH